MPQREKLFNWLVVGVTTALTLGLVAGDATDQFPALGTFLFWVALLVIVELLPVYLSMGTELTMGFVIILPVMMLFPTPVAMMIVGLGSFDPREFSREIPLHQALFNRAQSMLAVAAGSIPFSVLDLDTFNAFAIATASILHLAVNLGMVTLAVHYRKGTGIVDTAKTIVPEPIAGFALTYGLLTALGAVTAFVYTREGGGAWAVAAILIPLLFARMSIIGARNQHILSERLRHQQEALLVATDRIFEDREQERKRIAADMHDTTLQLLAGAAYATGNAEEMLASGEPDAARTSVSTARDAIERSMTSLRESLIDLRKSSIEEGGLLGSVEKFAADIATLWDAEVKIEGKIDHEPPVSVALAAFQILQESLTNAVKHSGSKNVTIRFSETEGKVHLVVEDDGVGFDPAEEAGHEHMGLQLLRERAATLGGSIEFVSSPGAGTKVEAILPAGTV